MGATSRANVGPAAASPPRGSCAAAATAVIVSSAVAPSAVRHRLLLGAVLDLRQRLMERQAQLRRQALGEVRDEVRTPTGRDAGHPLRRRTRAPLCHQLGAGADEIVHEPTVPVLAALDEAAPAGVAPGTKGPSGLGPMRRGDQSAKSVPWHAARGPSLARFDGQARAAEERHRLLQESRFDLRGQRRQVRRANGSRIPVQRPDEERHVPGFEPDILLHLALLLTPQGGQALRPLPESGSQIRGGQLPLGPLFRDGSR